MDDNDAANVCKKRKRGAQGGASPPAKKGKIYNTEEKSSVSQQQALLPVETDGPAVEELRMALVIKQPDLQLFVVTWSLLTLAPEIQLLILQHCTAIALARIDQVCTALSTPRQPLSILQTAVQNKLCSEYPSTSLNVESWPAHLAKIEQAHQAGSSWEDSTGELDEINKACKIDQAQGTSAALKLSDSLLKTERIRSATIKLLAKMLSAGPKDKTNCVKHIMTLSQSDRDSVVAAGALPPLAGLLSPKGTDTEKACVYAARAIWTINKGSKYQMAVVEAGVVGPLVHLLKEGSIDQRILALRTLSRITHGCLPDTRRATDAVVAAGVVEPIVIALRTFFLRNSAKQHQKLAKAAASLLCCIACGASIHCEALHGAEATEPLVQLLREGPNDARAYAGQALVDMAARKPALQAILASIFCQLLDSGNRMLDWFDVARGLGILAWRSQNIEKEFADVVVRLLIKALVNPMGFNSSNAENCVVMGLGCIGSVPEHLVAVMEPLVSAIQVSECNDAKTRIARTLAAIARKNPLLRGDLREDFHSTSMPSIDPALMDRMIPPLVQLVKEGSDQAKKHSADCLGCIANELRYISSVVANGAMEPLMSILHEQDANDVKQYAAMAIGNIAFAAEHAQTMVKMGVIKPLMQLLQVDYDQDGGEFAAMAISSLAFDTKCLDRMMAMGVVEPLVQLVQKGLKVSTPKPVTAKTCIEMWSGTFTLAWAVVALLAITASDKHDKNQTATDTLEFFKVHLPNCSDDVKLELAMALRETIQKQPSKRYVLQNAMTKALLDELASNGAEPTTQDANRAILLLYRKGNLH